MTTANVLNSGIPNVNSASASNSAKTAQEASSVNTSKMFRGYMKQFDKTDAISTEDSTVTNGKLDSNNSVTDYTKSQYKNNQIQQNNQTTLKDKISDLKDVVKNAEKEIVQAVADELGVGESEVEEAMETLGLLVLQLLQPENLVQLVSQLTETTDPAELLVNMDFQSLMQDMAAIGTELFQTLDVEPNQLDEIIAQMDALEEPVVVQTTEEVGAEENAEEKLELYTGLTDANELSKAEGITTQQEQINSADAASDSDKKVQAEVVKETSNASNADVPETEEKVTNFNVTEQTNDGSGEKHSDNSKEQMADQSANHGLMNGMNANAAQVDAMVQTPETPVYAKTSDQIELIQQIVERVKVTVGTGSTSMEMQLNPENLGKVYLQISSKQGSVNAQITAQNEAVRDALQTQVAALQDKLNQAGVKVDAIEVTVATHEFERNLEQNQGEQRQNEGRSEQGYNGRRNLNMNSLDGLEGLMSEEEILAAQIMKDNGNSVDLTA